MGANPRTPAIKTPRGTSGCEVWGGLCGSGGSSVQTQERLYRLKEGRREETLSTDAEFLTSSLETGKGKEGQGGRPAGTYPELVVISRGALLDEGSIVGGNIAVVRVFFQHVDLLFDLFLFVLGECEDMSPLLCVLTLPLPHDTPYLRDIHDLDGSQLPSLDMPTLRTERWAWRDLVRARQGLILGEATPSGCFLS